MERINCSKETADQCIRELLKSYDISHLDFIKVQAKVFSGLILFIQDHHESSFFHSYVLEAEILDEFKAAYMFQKQLQKILLDDD